MFQRVLATNSAVTDLEIYEWDGRTGQRHRKKILGFLGLRRPSGEDLQKLRSWLTAEVLALDVHSSDCMNWMLSGSPDNRWHHLIPGHLNGYFDQLLILLKLHYFNPSPTC